MSFHLKVRLLGLIFLGAFVLIIIKLFYIQALSAERFSAQADREHFDTLSLPARRGEIRSSDGFPLVSDKESYLLYVNLSKFTARPEKVVEDLAKVLAEGVPTATDEASLKKVQKDLEESLLDKFNLKNAVWINLAHFVGKDTKQKVEALKISGLGFETEESRDYPEASMSAQILGFVGFDDVGNPKGYFGLEGFYDRELSGKPGEIRVEKDALGRPIAIGSETRRDQQDGNGLVLTLDRGVQRFTEAELEQGIKDWKATGGTAIVMDPKTGAILALANFPRYDPRSFSYYPTKLYKSSAVADLFEPGSIMKPLVVAAALNENKVSPDTRCDQCNGPRKIGDDYIHTFNDQYHPNLNIPEILINSDNTGMVFVGEKLGFNNLYNYFQKYGFSQKTGIDLQEEDAGALRKIADYYPIDQATLVFGQGVVVSPIQMVRAWAALANGGYLVTPHLVSTIKTAKGDVQMLWPKGLQVLSATTTQIVREMLVRVARESPVHYPLDRIAELAKFRIAAKSGTAQIALKGAYAKTGTIASVIGFFPADDPKFLVLVKLNEPEVRPWGSDTAGPIFFSILKNLVSYYGLTP